MFDLMPIRSLHSERRAQISAGIVWTIVIMLAAVAFGGLIFGKIHTVSEEQADDGVATTETIAENIVSDVGKTGADVFPLVLLLVLIGVFVAIIAVLKVLA